MNCICKDWEEIDYFRSPGEFKKFTLWLDEQVQAGGVERVQPDPKYVGSQWEKWFRCKGCGRFWRLSEPEPPSRGGFSLVAKEPE